MNVSSYTAAEDAFPSKPAIYFLNDYFCSICKRLEVLFHVKLLGKLALTLVRIE